MSALTDSAPNLLKLVQAVGDSPFNLFTSQKPLTAETEFNPEGKQTKKEAENEEGEEAGEDISYETALGIKGVVYGTRMFTIDQDWKKTSFVRRSVDSAIPYGLIAPKDKARGLIMAVQAQLLLRILTTGDNINPNASEVANRLKLVYDWRQKKHFIESLATILWRAGQGKRASVVLLYPAYAGLLYSEQKRLEHFLKTVKVIECSTYKRLVSVLDKKLPMFEHQTGGGALQFLYSLILSRTIAQTERDLQGHFLLTDRDDCGLPLINLILTGVATPYLFNGTQEYDINSKLLSDPQHGIKQRSEMGLLVVDRPDGRDHRSTKKITIGSMLKTPLFPIWVLRLKGRYSLFYCCNLSLNRDWRSEAKFTLHFYTGQQDQLREAVITIDSRLRLREEKKKKDDKNMPILDECIQSRWPGAHIDWNGTTPFF